MQLFKRNDGLIFMKVGLHATESIDQILKRKRAEFDKAGKIFWGYGGNTCHPTAMVQPFATEVSKRRGKVMLVMHKMDSKHNAPPALASEYSDDGINWKPIPRGIKVTGSRYALVLDQIQDVNEELPLSGLSVAIGPSRGRAADQYLRGRVDKGCFELGSPSPAPKAETAHIDLIAPLQFPYAVFLR